MTLATLREHRPEALTHLFERYGSEIGAVAYLILRDRALAEDVLSETLMTALEQGHALRDPEALRPWLLRIATNHALGMKRRSARVTLLPTIPDRADVPAGITPEDRMSLWQGIGELPPRMRAVVVLRYYADLPIDGVAGAMGISSNTVKWQLQEALVRLRRALSDEPARSVVMRRA